ncbi:MAG: hypothetical protein ACOXZ7_07905 [Sphaerochaeta sp.]
MKKSLFVLLAVLVLFAFPAFAQGGKESYKPQDRIHRPNDR